MSRRQLQPLQEYSEMSGFASSGTASGHGTWMGLLLLAQLQVMLHGWVPQSCIFQYLTSGLQGLPGGDGISAAVLWSHQQSPFSV